MFEDFESNWTAVWVSLDKIARLTELFGIILESPDECGDGNFRVAVSAKLLKGHKLSVAGGVHSTVRSQSRNLQPKLTVRSKAHELEGVVVRLSIDQHKIRPDVAVSMVGPVSRQRVIPKIQRQRRVGCKQSQYVDQQCVQKLTKLARFFPLVIALEPLGSLNRPH